MIPKTESGRNLMVEVDAAAYRGGGITVADTLDRILAIEQEAASKAVAEVLDRLDAAINVLEQQPGYLLPMGSARALIASERKP